MPNDDEIEDEDEISKKIEEIVKGQELDAEDATVIAEIVEELGADTGSDPCNVDVEEAEAIAETMDELGMDEADAAEVVEEEEI